MNHIKFILIFCVIFCLSGVSAVGVSSGDNSFTFEKNVVKDIFFGISNIADGAEVKYSLDGDLARYGEIKEISNSRIRVSFLFTEDINIPGEHKIYFQAREVPVEDSNSTIQAMTSARVPIKIFVPYPYDYLDMKLNVKHLKFGDNYGLSVDIKNFGNNLVSDVTGEVILKSSDEVVKKIDLESTSLDIGQDFTWDFDLKVKKAGNYEIFANIYYLDKVKSVNNSFEVGEQSLIIKDFKKKFKIGEIEEFYISVENMWSDNMGEVYFEADFFDKNGVNIAHIGSTPIELKEFETKKLSDFFDITNASSGEYFLNGSVFFDGGREDFSSNVFFSNELVLNGVFLYGFVWVMTLFAYFKFKTRFK